MKSQKFLIVVLLISVLILLAACAPDEPITEVSGAPSTSGEVADSYPAPGEQEAVQPGDSDESYPAPQEIIVDDPASPNPYPPVEVVGNVSSMDLSEALKPIEFAVLSSDNDLQAGTIFIDHSEIIMKEGDPVQVELVLVGHLPTPCNQLRVNTSGPDEAGHIEVRAYSVSDPDKMCAQVLEPFIAVVPLGEYTEGTFTLSINHERKGEFKLP